MVLGGYESGLGSAGFFVHLDLDSAQISLTGLLLLLLLLFTLET